MVLVDRERLEARDLGTRECHVVRHKSVRVRREAVVDPKVDIHALFAVDFVPKLGRRHPRAIHQMLHVSCMQRRDPALVVPGHGRCQPPPVVQRQVLKADLVGKALSVHVVHEAVHGVDVVKVFFHARGSRVEDVGVKRPPHGRDPFGHPPRMQTALGKAGGLPIGGDS